VSCFGGTPTSRDFAKEVAEYGSNNPKIAKIGAKTLKLMYWFEKAHYDHQEVRLVLQVWNGCTG
jgi:uncharacterized membrane-anchored protein